MNAEAEKDALRMKYPEHSALGSILGCCDNLKHHRDLDRFLAEVAEIERIYQSRTGKAA